MKRRHVNKKDVNWSFFALIPCALFYCWNVLRLGLGIYDGGPDELVRVLVPQCIIQGDLIPSGYDECSIYSVGYYSYAFYPQMLGAYVSAFFMKLTQIFGLNANYIFVSGRLASVLFGLVAVYAFGKAVGIIFEGNVAKKWYQCFSMLVLGFWPQFAFLSSYINNDIVALAGVSILYWALISGLKNRWNYGNSLLLAAGLIICILGYLDSYGFVLMGIIVYLVSVCLQQASVDKNKFKMVILTAGIVAVVVLPFFILNYVRYHDFTGASVFSERAQQWARENGKYPMIPWDKGLRELLFGDIIYNDGFLQLTLTSFIGYLGHMAIPMPFIGVVFYSFFVLLGFGMAIPEVVNRGRNISVILLSLTSIVGSGITIFLHVYRTLKVDYQPQGRYIIAILIPLLLIVCVGIINTFKFQNAFSKALLFVGIFIYIAVAVVFFYKSGINFEWHGVSGL